MKTPKIPKPEPVKVMPIPDDKMVEKAKKKERILSGNTPRQPIT